MLHLITKIVSVTVPQLYQVHLVFSYNTKQTIDLGPLLKGPMYGTLKDPATFRAVKVDKETGTIAWPNGTDFDPATLYKREANRRELAERALQWEKRKSPDE